MHYPDAGIRRKPRHSWLISFFILLPTFMAACRDATAPAVPTEVEILTGDGQSGMAGSALAEAPALRVLDQHDRPLPGVSVAFAVAEGVGAVATASATTDERGIAAAGAWTLGPVTGRQTLTASVRGLPDVTFSATVLPGAPAALTPQVGDVQVAVVGTTLPVAPAIRVTDAHGNAVPGVLVRFTPGMGSGAIAANQRVSDENGLAVAGDWTLGTTAGTQTLQAEIDGLPAARFHATALAGPAAGLEIVSGNGQFAVVGTAVAVAPAVRVVDAFRNPVSGADVRFEIVVGDGALDGAQGSLLASSSDPLGVARVGRWTLGTRAGANSLRASLNSTTAVAVFIATGRAGTATSLQKLAGDGQTAAVNTSVPLAPAVRIFDAHGNGVPGQTVTFTALDGGSVTDGVQTTDESGIATVGSWQLGANPGASTLVASSPGLGNVSFTATASTAGGGGGSGSGGGGGGGGGTLPGGYDVEIRFSGTVTTAQQGAFFAAAGRWASVIAGDLTDVVVNIPANACGVLHGAISGTIDDLLILVNVTNIDGPGNVLGSAGPCWVRAAGGLPVVGAMNLDAADLAFLESNGRLMDVIAHEMGHIIGIGTRWGSLLVGAGGADPHFTGTSAISAFNGGGYTYTGLPVPVENTGGAGTRDGHWRESIMRNELMTGWLDLVSNPLSAVTIAALGDMGYTVNMAFAEGFHAGIADAALENGASRARIEIKEAPLGITPISVDARGRPVNGAALRR
jgi:hypothetical protein